MKRVLRVFYANANLVFVSSGLHAGLRTRTSVWVLFYV